MTTPNVQTFNTLLERGDVDALRTLMQAHPPGTFDLHRENKHGIVSFQRLLLAMGSNSTDQSAQEKREKVVEFLVAQGGPELINRVSKAGTAFHIAIDKNNPKMIRKLISLGADHNKCNNQGWSPLAVALSRNATELIDILMEQFKPSDFDNKSIVGIIKHNNVGVLTRMLNEHKIDIDFTAADKAGFTHAHVCAIKGSTQVFQLLLERATRDDLVSAFLTAKTNKGCTPLHLACKENSMEIIKLLLQNPNVDVNATDNNEWTPLMYAVAAGHCQVVKTLLQSPACDVNAKNKSKRTALMIVVSQVTFNSCLEPLLKRADIDLNASDKNGWTALHMAVLKLNTGAVERLVKEDKCNVNAKTLGSGLAPIHIAASCHRTNVVNALLSSDRCDLNAPVTKNGWTAMHIAAREDDIEIFRLLRSRGGDPTIQDLEGKTPLNKAFSPSTKTRAFRKFDKWISEFQGLPGLLEKKPNEQGHDENPNQEN